LLGYSQAFVLPVIQIAEWTGAYGVSFLIGSVNAAIASVVVLGLSRARGGLAAAAALLLLTLAVGWHALGASGEGTLRVAVVQPSIDQARKWDAGVLAQTLEMYRTLTVEAGQASPALVIWPETAAPISLRHDPATLERLRAMSREVRAPLVLGALDVAPGTPRRYSNSAFFLTGEGIEGKYDKIHLVPFGEYVPLGSLLGFVRGWADFISELESGTVHAVFPFQKTPFGVVICYEGIFPELFRQFVAKGAQFMVNMTNDAWFGKTSGPWQHLAVLPFRAVENRVAIARAANTGVSAMIEPTGRIRQVLGLFQRGVLVGHLVGRTRTTFYTRYGDLFAYACLGLALGALGWAALRRAV
jgi:apolipoprotein N-acyltransferase